VACVGVGVIGSSWAIAFARAGCEVRLYDTSASALRNAFANIDQMLARLGEVTTHSAAYCRPRIVAARTLQAALANVDFVQESIRENVGDKQAMFAELDALAPPNVLLASSTSEIPPSQFTETLAGRSRCFVAHPLNPPHLIPLVELCPSPWTSPSSLALARQFFESIGQEPIVIRKELPGFVANRLQVAVIAEALRLVAEGYCSAEDVDRAMRRGLGMRWTLMGPLETNRLAASGGYGHFFREYWPTLQSVASTLEPRYMPPSDIGDRIEQELALSMKGVSTADQADWRDRSLIRLRALLDELGRPKPQQSQMR
jgi:3-hydroxyacyl-CoA dehydrogenase